MAESISDNDRRISRNAVLTGEKMMKKLKPIFVIVLVLLTGLCLFACNGCKKNDDSGSGDKPGGDPSTPQNAITLNYYSKDMIYGDSLSLIATYEKQSGVTLVWSSTNEQVATVNEEGDVSTVSVGEADIIATYGENKATCHISVSFGEYLPQLIIENVSDGNIVLSKGSEYKIKGYVYFNGAKYYDGVEIENNGKQQSVVSISEDLTVTANDVGEAEIVFYTQWKGFGGSTLQKTITVKVVEDVEMNTYVQVGDNNEITDSIELSLVDEWQGKDYDSFAALSVDFMVGGEKVQKEYEFIKEDGTNVISVEGNKIYAENIGSTYITVKCVDGGKEYTNVINVTVVCPTENYEDRLDYCVSDDFAVNEIFGDGAVILSAYQGNRELTVKRGKILEGVVVNGAETEKLTLLSSLGGFMFENVNAYTDMIATAEEFVNVFKLANGKIIDGYYYLANDITVDMTAQTGSYYELNGKQNKYFQGIFDGQGYTLNATVGTYGLFGGFGHGTIIKNTHFNFTFSIADNASIKTACGLARNDGAVFAQGKWDVKFSNLKVTTTNYFDGSDGTSKRSYALTDFMNYRLSMEDIFVVINGASVDYVDYTSQVGALFRVDCNSMCASCNSMYNGGFRNIRVVTGTFMPISNGQYGSISGNLSYYTTYAHNDYVSSKTDKKAIVGSRGGMAENTAFCKITPNKDTSDAQNRLFGEVYFNDSITGELKSTKYAWVYSSSVSDGGIYRYDTIADLLSDSVMKIGTWTVG